MLWAARNVIHANVEKWLNQVGFLKVFQPSSLILGFSKHRRNRGRVRTGVMKGNLILERIGVDR